MPMGFPGGSVVKNPAAKQKTQVQLLSQEDPLKEEMTTHSSVLAQEIPWTEEPGGLQSMDSLVTKQQQFDPNRDCITDSKWRWH